jgi:hypothetical protein
MQPSKETKPMTDQKPPRDPLALLFRDVAQAWPTPTEQPEDFLRLPGLFRRWEIEQVLDAGFEFHIEEAGTASDHTQLFAVYRRETY